MPTIPITMTRFVSDDFPFWVAFQLVDAHGTVHEFVEKEPVITCDHLTPDSAYPIAATVACSVLGSWRDAAGVQVVKVSVDQPWGLESTSGLTEFVMLASLVSL